jgi:hypothetical protein
MTNKPHWAKGIATSYNFWVEGQVMGWVIQKDPGTYVCAAYPQRCTNKVGNNMIRDANPDVRNIEEAKLWVETMWRLG